MSINYVKGKPFFSDVEEKIPQFKYLNKNIDCDVLIIGGGINGAIANYYFSHDNIDTVLIEKNRLGYTSTACATSLLEYQLDDHAEDLTDCLSNLDVLNSYRIGLSALSDIEKIIEKHGNTCHYSKRDTLLYTLKKSEVAMLEKEYEFRKNNGLNVKFLTKENNNFPFEFEAGLLAKDKGAEFNPYLFTKLLLANCNKDCSRIYENTEAIKIENKPDEKLEVTCRYGIKILCNKVIASTGYNTTLFTKNKLCNKFVTYSIVTNQIENFSWQDKTMLQDNSDPYHYIRFSHDNRLVIGGEDTPFKNDFINEKKSQKKYDKLLKYTKQLLPQIAENLEIDYAFSGAFSATKNNLGVFGSSVENPSVWYCLGYGANGIINCIYGAQLLVKKYHNQNDEFEDLFSAQRKLT